MKVDKESPGLLFVQTFFHGIISNERANSNKCKINLTLGEEIKNKFLISEFFEIILASYIRGTNYGED